MPKNKLTAGRINDFSCESGAQSFLWDTEAKGLAVRATSNNAKSYVHQGKLNGRTVRLTIGNIKTWAIEEARQESRRLQTLLDRGIDPRQQKLEQAAVAEAQRSEAERRQITFGDAWPEYIEANKALWGKRHLQDHIRLIAPGGEERQRSNRKTVVGPLRKLFPVLLKDLTGEQIALWLKAESAFRPTSAALAYRLLRAFIRWANVQKRYSQLIPQDSYNSIIVKRALPKGQAKDDCLQREQLASWFEAVKKIENPITSAYLQILLITGARREELLSLRWSDVNFQWQVLSMRDKIEGKRQIPLTPYVAYLLRTLEKLNRQPTVRPILNDQRKGQLSPWVFPSPTSASGRLADPRAPHVQALEHAGLPHMTIHGLRRSFGTLCEWVEVPAGISAQIMGHKPSAIAEKHYRRRPIDLLRKWHEKIEGWILDQAGVHFEPGKKEVLKAIV